jgi:hypothetical protein
MNPFYWISWMAFILDSFNPFKLRRLLREALADRDGLERMLEEAQSLCNRAIRLAEMKAPAVEVPVLPDASDAIVALQPANRWVN